MSMGRTETDSEAPTIQDGEVGRGDGGLDSDEAKRSCDSPFFFVESAVLSAALKESWTRDELLVYLLHCRGYSARSRCSLMGARAARNRLGVTKKPWEDAHAALEQRGWLRTVSGQGSRRPLVCIAGAAAPYRESASVGDRPKGIDGHRYRDVAGESLVKAPWTLIDGSTDGSAPSLADLRSVDAVLLLLSIHGLARADGVIPLRETWVAEGEAGDFAVQFGDATLADLLGDPAALGSSASELLGCGLLYAGVQGIGGKWVLHLAHPMAPVALRIVA